MSVNDYEASVLFKQNYASTAHIVVNQGGTSSGKTYAIEQVLFCLASEAEKQIIWPIFAYYSTTNFSTDFQSLQPCQRILIYLSFFLFFVIFHLIALAAIL